MKRIVFISCIIFITFITITSCGGEEPEHPDDDQDNDEIVVTDDEPDNEQPDELIDEENPDEDQVVTNFCEKMLDIAGDWYKVEGGDKITMTLVSQENTCEVTMTWQQGWTTTWHGLELPLEKVYDSETERYFALKKSGGNLVRVDTLKNGDPDKEVTFAR